MRAAPRLLVLDEPTVGLDPVLRRDLWHRFHALAATGTSVFVSNHVMDEADRCDRLLLLRAGLLVAEDTPAGLCARTGAPDVERLPAPRRGPGTGDRRRGGAPVTPFRAAARSAHRAMAVVPAVVVPAAAAAGGYAFTTARGWVSTDEARISGDALPIRAPVSGALVDWRLTAGSPVRADEPVGRI